MFSQKIESFRRTAEKKILRDFYNKENNTSYRTVTQIRKSMGLSDAGEVYSALQDEYNARVSCKIGELCSPIISREAITEGIAFFTAFRPKIVISDRVVKFYKKDFINKKFNDAVINTQFINTTLSAQISMKFALSEYSMKTKYLDFIFNIKQKIKNTYNLIGNYPFIVSDETTEKLVLRMYQLLMAHSGQFNRIFITNTESGKIVSSKLKDNFSYADFEEVIQSIIQSAGIEVLGELTFTIQQRNMPSGGSCVDVPSFLKDKRGVSIILNDDDLCGQRCLVLADCPTNQTLKDLKKDKYKVSFHKKLITMCKDIELNGKMSFVDFEKYADLRKKQVIIVSGLFVVMYETQTEYGEQIYIYYDVKAQHYHFIHDINAASNDSKRHNKWCMHCKKSIRYENFNKHKCVETKCVCCRTNFCSVIEKDKHFSDAKINKSWVKCDKCNRWAAGDNCLEKHNLHCKGKEIQCSNCKKFICADRYSEHRCHEKHCLNCDTYHLGEHRCFIKPISGNDGWSNTIYAYDFESMFDDKHNHIVNLCIVKELFGNREMVFNNIEDFVKFAVSCKQTTFIAHNGKAYDNWMVHKYIIRHTEHRPTKLILAGNKIMYMKVKTVRFIDSLNHIAQGLATFPKTFGLKEMKKGFFPYLFNIAKNQNYVGVIPDKSFFNPFSMSCEKYTEFNAWYDTQKNIIYDFKKELYEYCNSDVDILKRSLEIYVTDGLKINRINPLRCSTVASYCMRVYRSNYLEENEIAILTKPEYDFCKRGFFGGRTEVFKMIKTWTDEEIKNGKYGKYVDIQSLYPSVQFFDDLPCGIPKWDNEPIYDDVIKYLDNHYGYIECDIVCPKNIHIPLLPEKKNNKLIFDLVDKVKKVYSSIELKKAIEVGYKVTKIYTSLSFDKSSDLFTGYIQNFLKIKTESAGYDGDDIDDYIKRYYNACGVKLDKEKITKNSGMKLLAKICLNSLWGKFGQNDELPTTVYLNNDSWFRLLNRHANNKVELKNEVMIDEDTIYVSYIEKEQSRTSLTTTNIGLAGFVTANARLRLYKELYALDKRVIYCDTDSIIYEYDKSKYNVTEGDCLGEWELEEDEDENKVKHAGNLSAVYALAPKTYGYTTLTGLQKYKCKGITLNSGNKLHFTYDKLKTLITGNPNGDHDEIITYSNDFVKDNKTGNIYTKMEVPKITAYNVSDFKRIFDTNGCSKPFI